MAAFFASDSGLTVAWVLLVLGLSDVLIGWLWLGRGRGMQDITEGMPRLRRWLPAVFVLDALLIGLGLYGLRLHGVI